MVFQAAPVRKSPALPPSMRQHRSIKTAPDVPSRPMSAPPRKPAETRVPELEPIDDNPRSYLAAFNTAWDELDGVLCKASLSASHISNLGPAQAAPSGPPAGAVHDERLETSVTATAALLSSNAPEPASLDVALHGHESDTVPIVDEAELEDGAGGGGGVRVVAVGLKEPFE